MISLDIEAVQTQRQYVLGTRVDAQTAPLAPVLVDVDPTVCHRWTLLGISVNRPRVEQKKARLAA
jgi:hypothetical protein